MKPSEVLEMIGRLEVVYREELSDLERQLWIEELADMDAGAVTSAAEARIRSEERFLPRIGELLATVRAAGRPDPSEAWAEVLAEVRRVGLRGEPSFSHPAIERAVEVMSWSRICNGSADSPFEARDFERIFARVLEGEDRRAAYARSGALSGSDRKALPGAEGAPATETERRARGGM